MRKLVMVPEQYAVLIRMLTQEMKLEQLNT